MMFIIIYVINGFSIQFDSETSAIIVYIFPKKKKKILHAIWPFLDVQYPSGSEAQKTKAHNSTQ